MAYSHCCNYHQLAYNLSFRILAMTLAPHIRSIASQGFTSGSGPSSDSDIMDSIGIFVKDGVVLLEFNRSYDNCDPNIRIQSHHQKRDLKQP